MNITPEVLEAIGATRSNGRQNTWILPHSYGAMQLEQHEPGSPTQHMWSLSLNNDLYTRTVSCYTVADLICKAFWLGSGYGIDQHKQKIGLFFRDELGLGDLFQSTDTDRSDCIKCSKSATWIRYTQFSGNHPFCEKCAKEEADFGKSDSSYFSWKEAPATRHGADKRRSVRARKDAPIYDM